LTAGKVHLPAMAGFYHLMGVREDDFHLSHRFLTSWLLPPIFLAILRAFIAIYAFTTIFFIFAWQGTHGLADVNDGEFSYFTSLTFWGIAFYFLFSAIHTVLYARRGSAPLDHWPRPLQALHSLFYTTVVTFPFLVTIVFWVLLYDGPWFPIKFNAWSNVSVSYSWLFQRLTNSLPDLSPRPQLSLRSPRTTFAFHKPSALAAPSVPYLDPRSILGPCLPHICDPRILHIQFPGSRNRARTSCCLLLWYIGGRNRGFYRRLATHLGSEKIHSHWEEGSSRQVTYEIW
jgi:hypothetical protein